MIGSLNGLILLLASAAAPGFGPLFLGVANFSLYGMLTGVLLLLVYTFVIILTINGDFLRLETYTYMFNTLFNNSQGYYLERNAWLIVLLILVFTLTCYVLSVYYSYKICISMKKSIVNSSGEKMNDKREK